MSYAANDGGIFICSIQPGSAADRCHILEVGDQVIQVDGTSFENLTNDQCLALLKKAANEERDIVLVVAKRVTDQRSETLSGLCDTMAVDVSMWVETTKQPGVDVVGFETEPVNGRSGSVNGKTDVVTSDEERAAYDDRRNGIGYVISLLLTEERPSIRSSVSSKLITYLTVAILSPLSSR